MRCIHESRGPIQPPLQPRKCHEHALPSQVSTACSLARPLPAQATPRRPPQATYHVVARLDEELPRGLSEATDTVAGSGRHSRRHGRGTAAGVRRLHRLLPLLLP